MRADRFRAPLVIAATVAWVLAALLVLSFVSWWLVLAALLAGLASVPALLRTVRSTRRLRAARDGSPEAAWREVLDASADRGVSVAEDQASLRTMAERIVERHELAESAHRALGRVVAELERAWYSAGQAASNEPEDFEQAVRTVLADFRQLRFSERYWPRSVLRSVRQHAEPSEAAQPAEAER